jgi:pilus assembly protein CpaE
MDQDRKARTPERGKAPAADSLSIATLCIDKDSAEQIRSFLESMPLAQLVTELQHYLADEQDSVFVDRLKDLRPDICIIDFDRDREKAGRTAERIREVLTETAIFAASSKSQSDLIIRAMRSGCSEYLSKPVGRDQLLESLARVGARRKEKGELTTGQLLAFLSAKGGTGATTLSIHVAAHLARNQGRRTLLVDLHPDLGDAAIFLALTRHQYHFYDLAENTHRLDSDFLKGFVVRHPSGLDVLPAPDGVDTPRHVPTDAMQRIMEFLRSQYEFVVVDCFPALTEEVMTVIDMADQVFLVATPEIPALRNVARHLEFMGRFDYPRDKVRVVINRHMKGGAITDAQIEKAIRKNIYWKVPNQYNEVIRAINNGDPLSVSPKSELMASLTEWTSSLTGKLPQGPKKQEKGMFDFLGG